MATTVDFHRLARAEVRRVRNYYGRAGYGARFLAALQDAIAAIEASPGIGSPDLFGTRFIRLRKFPYRLVYVEEPTRVLILAVPHNSRRPGTGRGGSPSGAWQYQPLQTGRVACPL